MSGFVDKKHHALVLTILGTVGFVVLSLITVYLSWNFFQTGDPDNVSSQGWHQSITTTK